MPDFDELNHITQLAELLSSMPPQQPGGARIQFGIPAKRVQWATELVRDYGVRVHRDLAKKEMVVTDAAAAAAVARATGKPTLPPDFMPRRAIDKIDAKFLLDLLRSAGEVPGLVRLADELEQALGDPAAETAMLERISQQQPDVVSTARKLYEQHLATAQDTEE